MYPIDPDMCYCEQKDGATPDNGIICLDVATDVAVPTGHCAATETCTGATADDDSTTWVLVDVKGELCT